MTYMTSSEAMVETLRAEGISEVFGIVGSAYMDALDIFPAAGIRWFAGLGSELIGTAKGTVIP